MKILMATGGSPHSEKALHFGAQIAQYIDEPPTVLTVVKRQADRPRGEAILAHAQTILSPFIPEARLRIRVGQPSEEIIREAREGGYNLVIVGEKQSHTWKARMLGSTAVHVVEHAACPVIIAKGQIGPIKRILLCDSGVPGPTLLSRFTAQLADVLHGEEDVTVLHVMSQITAGPLVSGEQLEADAAELISERTPEGEILERDIEALSLADVHSQPKVRHGPVVEEILDEACAGDYDLVVIGAHREEGWQRVLLADIAHQIITHVDRPVLVVR